jgi:hypothetical protein
MNRTWSVCLVGDAAKSLRLRCWLSILSAAFTLFGQSPSPPSLVHLRVAALDPAGRPVSDLSASDFKIWDQGKLQTIVAFSHQAAAPLGPREYTNRPGGVVPHHTAILFDLLNQDRSDHGEISGWLQARSRQRLPIGPD